MVMKVVMININIFPACKWMGLHQRKLWLLDFDGRRKKTTSAFRNGKRIFKRNQVRENENTSRRTMLEPIYVYPVSEQYSTLFFHYQLITLRSENQPPLDLSAPLQSLCLLFTFFVDSLFPYLAMGSNNFSGHVHNNFTVHRDTYLYYFKPFTSIVSLYLRCV